MTSTNKKISLSAILLGLSVAVGPAVGGYLIGKAIERFKSSDRTVTAKGLVEREVKADQASWKITYVVGDNDLAILAQKMKDQQGVIIDFLKGKGVKEENITINPSAVQDLTTQTYANAETIKTRFIGDCSITVQSEDVDLIGKISKETDELIKAGIAFRGDRYDGMPRYYVKKLNDLKPEMLAEAVANARKSAEKLIESSGAKVGSIRTAHQGQFNIYANDVANQESSYQSEQSINKIVRVVSTITFNLDN